MHPPTFTKFYNKDYDATTTYTNALKKSATYSRPNLPFLRNLTPGSSVPPDYRTAKHRTPNAALCDNLNVDKALTHEVKKAIDNVDAGF